MLPQEEMIDRIRRLCREDDTLRAAMMYGSFALGEADAYSDIEFLFFFRDDALEALDKREWLEGIAPVEILFINEFGVTTALFANLVRGEFHFDSVSDMEALAATWPGVVWFPSFESTLIVDKDGQLAPLLAPIIGQPLRHGTTPEEVQTVVNRFLNWFLFGWTVLERGEWARALELLGFVQRHLLLIVRILEGQTEHWHIPSRRLEIEISSDAYTRYRTCTAGLDDEGLRRAYRNAWGWVQEMLPELVARRGVQVPPSLLSRISERVE